MLLVIAYFVFCCLSLGMLPFVHTIRNSPPQVSVVVTLQQQWREQNQLLDICRRHGATGLPWRCSSGCPQWDPCKKRQRWELVFQLLKPWSSQQCLPSVYCTLEKYHWDRWGSFSQTNSCMMGSKAPAPVFHSQKRKGRSVFIPAFSSSHGRWVMRRIISQQIQGRKRDFPEGFLD